MNFDRGFGHHYDVEIAGNLGNFTPAKPPASRPCIDDARRWLGCTPTRQAQCAFFDGKRKLPGCSLYSKAEYDPAYKPLRIARNLLPIDPTINQLELDGFHIEEAS